MSLRFDFKLKKKIVELFVNPYISNSMLTIIVTFFNFTVTLVAITDLIKTQDYRLINE